MYKGTLEQSKKFFTLESYIIYSENRKSYKTMGEVYMNHKIKNKNKQEK